ncbi:TVP38/TMEM64 family protein [Cyanobium sp. Cruz CV13-4-11]|nr:TVP38/TMEM64 family protein [Cyanobium sp. Cruz CV11-17]MCP9918739.1 TVP38/TMEM64 family protein [Cyanobium sp. Cruz CV13-4-11]
MDSLWLPDHLLPWLRSPVGAVAFVPLYALWVTILLPGVWASMLAGVLYGPFWGSVLVFAGACLGAQAMFLLGRGRWRGWARRRLAGAPRLLAVERAVCRQGLALVLLTRLSPAFPFSLLNLAYGLSEVSLWDYSIGLIGILPGTVLFCALGAAAGDPSRFAPLLAGPADGATWSLRLLGVVATLAAVLPVGRQVRLALEERGVASAVAIQASDGDGRDSPQPHHRRLPQLRRRTSHPGATGAGEQGPGGG